MECRIEGITFRECTTLQSERKWAKGKSCGGYQLLPLQSANNAVISIKRMQTHLAVDCCQEQVDVLSRNVTNSSAHISHQRGNVPEIHAGNERFARRGLGFSEAQSPACARGTPQPRVDLTHALQSLSYLHGLMTKWNWKLNEIWFGFYESSAGSLEVVGREVPRAHRDTQGYERLSGM